MSTKRANLPYFRKPRPRPGSLEAWDNSRGGGGGAPLYSPVSLSMKKTDATAVTGQPAAPIVETHSDGPVSGGAPLNGKGNGNNVEVSADNESEVAISQDTKLNPNTKPFVPPSAGSKNDDVKTATNSGDKKANTKNTDIKPENNYTDVLMQMINNATAGSPSKTNGQITSRIPHSRTYNDGFDDGPASVPGKNDIDQGHAAGASTLTNPSMQVQQNGYADTMQDSGGTSYGNGTLYNGQQVAGTQAQSYNSEYTSETHGNSYGPDGSASYTTNQYHGNGEPMNMPMPARGHGQQPQIITHGSQYIHPGNGGYTARDYQGNLAGSGSGGSAMNTTAYQPGQHEVRHIPGENNTGHRNNADLGNRIAAARQAMDQHAASPSAYYSNNAPTQMAPTPDRTRTNPATIPNPAPAHLPASTSGLEALLGITKSVPMFQPPTADTKAQRSPMLNRLVGDSGRPTINSLMDPDNFPFIEPGRANTSVDYGVVKIRNIPYATTRSEIIAVLGKNAKILNDNLEPVHIIMERVTSKTHDAYVEVLSLDDAINVVDRYYSHKNRAPRLGERPIEMEVSSQSQLMNDLFPVASGVIWHGSIPEIKPSNYNEPWDNFKTFVTAEEMTMLVKHVEVPQRSPFSRESPERPYESIISTLKKMPWYMTDCITIKQRYIIYEACYKLVALLKHAIKRREIPFERAAQPERVGAERLTEQLYRRLIKAIMLCPGFTVLQKDNIADLVEMGEKDMRDFNMPRFAHSWTHLYTLGPKPGIPLDVLEYYIALIREETNRVVQAVSIREKQELAGLARTTDGYWGFFWREVGYKDIAGPAFDNLTLAGAAAMEWEAVDRILRRAVLRGGEDGDYGGSDDSGHGRKQITGGENHAMITYQT